MTIVETTDSGERGMNPVAMTTTNPRKEYWPSHGSNQRPPVLKSATLPTELWGSAILNELWCALHKTDTENVELYLSSIDTDGHIDY